VEQAIFWYRQAAAKGHEKALTSLERLKEYRS